MLYLIFLSVCVCVCVVCVYVWCVCVCVCSVLSDSLQPHGLYPPASSVHGIFQARILEVLAILLQEIFLTQESNSSLLHCRQILYCLSHREAQEYWSG